jgi:hypothetical protein
MESDAEGSTVTITPATTDAVRAVIRVAPGLTPCTMPVAGSTVATRGSLLAHAIVVASTILPDAFNTLAASASDRPGESASGLAGRISMRRAASASAPVPDCAGGGAGVIAGAVGAVVAVLVRAAAGAETESSRSRSPLAGAPTLGGDVGVESAR